MQKNILIWVFIVLTYAGIINANIARNKPAIQSSTNSPYEASRAVDGDYYWAGCSHTLGGRQTAWWRVDLQDTYIITSVTITPRSWLGGGARLAGYSVYISNVSLAPLTGASQCFVDSNEALPSVQTIQISPCTAPITGRYVIIYNERRNDKTYPPGWSQDAILELCEVEVEACQTNCANCPCTTCTAGWYGPNCTNSCSNCGGDGSCDKVNGYCNADLCRDGFYGDKCDFTCPKTCGGTRSCDKPDGDCKLCNTGSYGDKCQYSCSNCGGDGLCDRHSGDCSAQSCKDGFYRSKCRDACLCANSTCNFYSGYCDRCDGNKFGIACNETCPSHCVSCYDRFTCHACNTGWYGSTCQSNCSNCGGNGNCHKTGGLCVGSSCRIGYFNGYCNARCSQSCTGDGSCEFISGQCNSCPGGIYGTSCQYTCTTGCKVCNNNSTCIECNPKLYGTQCNKNCPACGGNGTCTIADGTCISDSCETGYYGGDGRCDKTCPTNCEGDGSCHKDSGDCLQGCVKRFTGFRCNLICPANCGGDGSCNKESRNCTQGCHPGWFSAICNKTCPSKCGGDNSCNVDNGKCSQGCKPGWQGENCTQECDTGWYGRDCSDECGHCRNYSCDHINGTCKEGCQEGWSSALCNIAVLERTGGSGMIPAAAGGAGAGLAVLVIVLVVVVVIIRRRKKKPQKKSNLYTPALTNKLKEGNVYANITTTEQPDGESLGQKNGSRKSTTKLEAYKNKEEEKTYYNSVESFRGTNINELKDYVMKKRASKGFQKEFKELPYGALQPTSVGEIPKNVKKNRFKTTLPYDHSRVTLSGQSDYINANYIEDMDGGKKYIATQGPLEHTIADFWQMVWENNVGKIIMLTNLKEGEKVKCQQYWPNPNSPVTYGSYRVTLKDQREFSYFVFRELQLEDTKAKTTRKILHYHFTQWPDHGTPDPLLLVLFHQRVIGSKCDLDGPEVVHCSAGIGRTGTFIALGALERYGRKYGRVDIKEYVNIMRKDRMNMVQTADQYEVLHEALVEAFQWKDTSIPMDRFLSVWQEIEKDTGPLNQRKLKKEYDQLKEVTTISNGNETTAARKEENKSKNRCESIMAFDKHRPYLSSYLRGSNDYINAVIIPSYTRKVGHFVTQLPLPETIVDFWRLLDDHESYAVVYLASAADEEVEFYPDREEIFTTDMHDVKKTTEIKIQENVLETKLQMTNKKKGSSNNVVVWKVDMGKEPYPTPSQLFAVYNQIEVFSKRHENTIFTVVSLDGCTPCDVFCAVSNTLEYMKIDNQIDVFQTARQLLLRRPEFFKDYESYRYCYQVINEYLATESVYFNT